MSVRNRPRGRSSYLMMLNNQSVILIFRYISLVFSLCGWRRIPPAAYSATAGVNAFCYLRELVRVLWNLYLRTPLHEWPLQKTCIVSFSLALSLFPYLYIFALLNHHVETESLFFKTMNELPRRNSIDSTKIDAGSSWEDASLNPSTPWPTR